MWHGNQITRRPRPYAPMACEARSISRNRPRSSPQAPVPNDRQSPKAAVAAQLLAPPTSSLFPSPIWTRAPARASTTCHHLSPSTARLRGWGRRCAQAQVASQGCRGLPLVTRRSSSAPPRRQRHTCPLACRHGGSHGRNRQTFALHLRREAFRVRGKPASPSARARRAFRPAA